MASIQMSGKRMWRSWQNLQMKNQQRTGIPEAQRATRRMIRTANKTTQMTTVSTIIRQAARRPALRWYSCAVVNSSAASAVWTAIESIFDSMLSAHQRYEPPFVSGEIDNSLTKHSTLFLDKCSQIPEYLGQLMDTGLDLTNFCFSFLSERFLICQFLWRKLCMEHLCLTLRRCLNRVVLTNNGILVEIDRNHQQENLRCRFIFYRNLDTFDYCSLTFCADLLCTLESK